MGLWGVFVVIRERQKQRLGESDIEEWREGLYRKIRERVDAHTEEERQGYAAPGFARFSEWCAAYVRTGYVMGEQLREAMFDAGFTAGVDAKSKGNDDDQAKRASLEARQEALTNTEKMQSDLLREILGDPFDGTHDDDFE